MLGALDMVFLVALAVIAGSSCERGSPGYSRYVGALGIAIVCVILRLAEGAIELLYTWFDMQ